MNEDTSVYSVYATCHGAVDAEEYFDPDQETEARQAYDSMCAVYADEPHCSVFLYCSFHGNMIDQQIGEDSAAAKQGERTR